MVKLTPPPGNVQDKTVYDYLYQLQEYLGLVLDGISDPGGAVVAASKLSASAAAKEATQAASAEIQQQVANLISLIIKTADEVRHDTSIDISGLLALIDGIDGAINGEGGLRAILMTIQDNYLATSTFGTFKESIEQTLSATGETLEQWIKSVGEVRRDLDATSADFNAYRVESEGYIRSGIVGYKSDGITPIIGIAIGQNLKVMQDASGNDVTDTATDPVTGETRTYKVLEQSGFRAIYAADELSFWIDDVKVAYMSNQQLYITDVKAINRLTVGNWSWDDGASGLVLKWGG